MREAIRASSHVEDAEVRSRFRRVAERLSLRVEDQPAMPRLIGIAFVMAAHAVVDTHESRMPKARDDGAIRRVLTAWSSMHPDDVARHWKALALHPYVILGDRGLQEVDQRAVNKFLKGRELRMFHRAFELYKPRKVRLSNFRIVYIGRAVACATFHERETSRNKRTYLGNAGALLLKKAGKWRIAVLSKQGLFA